MSVRVQRLRVRYARGPEVRYVSHLDMLRFWERALRRAHVPVAYSEGFTPHPQINLGAPLSVGLTSRAELLDVFVSRAMAAEELHRILQEQMPRGMRIDEVADVPVAAPSLPALVRAAVYALHLRQDADMAEVEQRLQRFLATETFPWEHRREKDVKRYDLRPMVLDLRRDQVEGDAAVIARLRAEEGATARPDQLAAALGIADQVSGIERLAIVLAEPVPANG